jgi:hypothetical protein
MDRSIDHGTNSYHGRPYSAPDPRAAGYGLAAPAQGKGRPNKQDMTLLFHKNLLLSHTYLCLNTCSACTWARTTSTTAGRARPSRWRIQAAASLSNLRRYDHAVRHTNVSAKISHVSVTTTSTSYIYLPIINRSTRPTFTCLSRRPMATTSSGPSEGVSLRGVSHNTTQPRHLRNITECIRRSLPRASSSTPTPPSN